MASKRDTSESVLIRGNDARSASGGFLEAPCACAEDVVLHNEIQQDEAEKVYPDNTKQQQNTEQIQGAEGMDNISVTEETTVSDKPFNECVFRTASDEQFMLLESLLTRTDLKDMSRSTSISINANETHTAPPFVKPIGEREFKEQEQDQSSEKPERVEVEEIVCKTERAHNEQATDRKEFKTLECDQQANNSTQEKNECLGTETKMHYTEHEDASFDMNLELSRVRDESSNNGDNENSVAEMYPENESIDEEENKMQTAHVLPESLAEDSVYQCNASEEKTMQTGTSDRFTENDKVKATLPDSLTEIVAEGHQDNEKEAKTLSQEGVDTEHEDQSVSSSIVKKEISGDREYFGLSGVEDAPTNTGDNDNTAEEPPELEHVMEKASTITGKIISSGDNNEENIMQFKDTNEVFTEGDQVKCVSPDSHKGNMTEGNTGSGKEAYKLPEKNLENLLALSKEVETEQEDLSKISSIMTDETSKDTENDNLSRLEAEISEGGDKKSLIAIEEVNTLSQGEKREEQNIQMEDAPQESMAENIIFQSENTAEKAMQTKHISHAFTEESGTSPASPAKEITKGYSDEREAKQLPEEIIEDLSIVSKEAETEHSDLIIDPSIDKNETIADGENDKLVVEEHPVEDKVRETSFEAESTNIYDDNTELKITQMVDISPEPMEENNFSHNDTKENMVQAEDTSGQSTEEENFKTSSPELPVAEGHIKDGEETKEFHEEKNECLGTEIKMHDTEQEDASYDMNLDLSRAKDENSDNGDNENLVVEMYPENESIDEEENKMQMAHVQPESLAEDLVYQCNATDDKRMQTDTSDIFTENDKVKATLPNSLTEKVAEGHQYNEKEAKTLSHERVNTEHEDQSVSSSIVIKETSGDREYFGLSRVEDEATNTGDNENTAAEPSKLEHVMEKASTITGKIISSSDNNEENIMLFKDTNEVFTEGDQIKHVLPDSHKGNMTEGNTGNGKEAYKLPEKNLENLLALSKEVETEHEDLSKISPIVTDETSTDTENDNLSRLEAEVSEDGDKKSLIAIEEVTTLSQGEKREEQKIRMEDVPQESMAENIIFQSENTVEKAMQTKHISHAFTEESGTPPASPAKEIAGGYSDDREAKQLPEEIIEDLSIVSKEAETEHSDLIIDPSIDKNESITEGENDKLVVEEHPADDKVGNTSFEEESTNICDDNTELKITQMVDILPEPMEENNFSHNDTEENMVQEEDTSRQSTEEENFKTTSPELPVAEGHIKDGEETKEFHEEKYERVCIGSNEEEEEHKDLIHDSSTCETCPWEEDENLKVQWHPKEENPIEALSMTGIIVSQGEKNDEEKVKSEDSSKKFTGMDHVTETSIENPVEEIVESNANDVKVREGFPEEMTVNEDNENLTTESTPDCGNIIEEAFPVAENIISEDEETEEKEMQMEGTLLDAPPDYLAKEKADSLENEEADTYNDEVTTSIGQSFSIKHAEVERKPKDSGHDSLVSDYAALTMEEDENPIEALSMAGNIVSQGEKTDEEKVKSEDSSKKFTGKDHVTETSIENLVEEIVESNANDVKVREEFPEEMTVNEDDENLTIEESPEGGKIIEEAPPVAENIILEDGETEEKEMQMEGTLLDTPPESLAMEKADSLEKKEAETCTDEVTTSVGKSFSLEHAEVERKPKDLGHDPPVSDNAALKLEEDKEVMVEQNKQVTGEASLLAGDRIHQDDVLKMQKEDASEKSMEEQNARTEDTNEVLTNDEHVTSISPRDPIQDVHQTTTNDGKEEKYSEQVTPESMEGSTVYHNDDTEEKYMQKDHISPKVKGNHASISSAEVPIELTNETSTIDENKARESITEESENITVESTQENSEMLIEQKEAKEEVVQVSSAIIAENIPDHTSMKNAEHNLSIDSSKKGEGIGQTTEKDMEEHKPEQNVDVMSNMGHEDKKNQIEDDNDHTQKEEIKEQPAEILEQDKIDEQIFINDNKVAKGVGKKDLKPPEEEYEENASRENTEGMLIGTSEKLEELTISLQSEENSIHLEEKICEVTKEEESEAELPRDKVKYNDVERCMATDEAFVRSRSVHDGKDDFFVSSQEECSLKQRSEKATCEQSQSINEEIHQDLQTDEDKGTPNSSNKEVSLLSEQVVDKVNKNQKEHEVKKQETKSTEETEVVMISDELRESAKNEVAQEKFGTAKANKSFTEQYKELGSIHIVEASDKEILLEKTPVHVEASSPATTATAAANVDCIPADHEESFSLAKNVETGIQVSGTYSAEQVSYEEGYDVPDEDSDAQETIFDEEEEADNSTAQMGDILELGKKATIEPIEDNGTTEVIETVDVAPVARYIENMGSQEENESKQTDAEMQMTSEGHGDPYTIEKLLEKNYQVIIPSHVTTDSNFFESEVVKTTEDGKLPDKSKTLNSSNTLEDYDKVNNESYKDGLENKEHYAGVDESALETGTLMVIQEVEKSASAEMEEPSQQYEAYISKNGCLSAYENLESDGLVKKIEHSTPTKNEEADEKLSEHPFDSTIKDPTELRQRTDEVTQTNVTETTMEVQYTNMNRDENEKLTEGFIVTNQVLTEHENEIKGKGVHETAENQSDANYLQHGKTKTVSKPESAQNEEQKMIGLNSIAKIERSNVIDTPYNQTETSIMAKAVDECHIPEESQISDKPTKRDNELPEERTREQEQNLESDSLVEKHENERAASDTNEKSNRHPSDSTNEDIVEETRNLLITDQIQTEPTNVDNMKSTQETEENQIDDDHLQHDEVKIATSYESTQSELKRAIDSTNITETEISDRIEKTPHNQSEASSTVAETIDDCSLEEERSQSSQNTTGANNEPSEKRIKENLESATLVEKDENETEILNEETREKFHIHQADSTKEDEIEEKVRCEVTTEETDTNLDLQCSINREINENQTSRDLIMTNQVPMEPVNEDKVISVQEAAENQSDANEHLHNEIITVISSESIWNENEQATDSNNIHKIESSEKMETPYKNSKASTVAEKLEKCSFPEETGQSSENINKRELQLPQNNKEEVEIEPENEDNIQELPKKKNDITSPQHDEMKIVTCSKSVQDENENAKNFDKTTEIKKLDKMETPYNVSEASTVVSTLEECGLAEGRGKSTTSGEFELPVRIQGEHVEAETTEAEDAAKQMKMVHTEAQGHIAEALIQINKNPTIEKTVSDVVEEEATLESVSRADFKDVEEIGKNEMEAKETAWPSEAEEQLQQLVPVEEKHKRKIQVTGEIAADLKPLPNETEKQLQQQFSELVTHEQKHKVSLLTEEIAEESVERVQSLEDQNTNYSILEQNKEVKCLQEKMSREPDVQILDFETSKSLHQKEAIMQEASRTDPEITMQPRGFSSENQCTVFSPESEEITVADTSVHTFLEESKDAEKSQPTYIKEERDTGIPVQINIAPSDTANGKSEKVCKEITDVDRQHNCPSEQLHEPHHKLNKSEETTKKNEKHMTENSDITSEELNTKEGFNQCKVIINEARCDQIGKGHDAIAKSNQEEEDREFTKKQGEYPVEEPRPSDNVLLQSEEKLMATVEWDSTKKHKGEDNWQVVSEEDVTATESHANERIQITGEECAIQEKQVHTAEMSEMEGYSVKEEGVDAEDPSSIAPTITDAAKATPKKSHNLLSGVGSKVKHSISKVKKAITGKPKNTSPKKAGE